METMQQIKSPSSRVELFNLRKRVLSQWRRSSTSAARASGKCTLVDEKGREGLYPAATGIVDPDEAPAKALTSQAERNNRTALSRVPGSGEQLRGRRGWAAGRR